MLVWLVTDAFSQVLLMASLLGNKFKFITKTALQRQCLPQRLHFKDFIWLLCYLKISLDLVWLFCII